MRASTIEELSFPRSNFGDAIPMVWGTVRQKSPVLLYYGGMIAAPIDSNGVTVGYNYHLTMDMAICLGPNVYLREIWAENKQLWIGSAHNEVVTINMPDAFGGPSTGGGMVGSLSFWSGNFPTDPDPNLPDPWLVSLGFWPQPTYGGVCHIVAQGINYGTQATPKPFSFVVSRWPDGLNPGKSMMPNGYDINPMEIIYDIITSDWGGLGLSPSVIDLPSFIAASNTLYSEGLGMSLILQNAVEAKTALQECMKVADGLLYMEPSTGKIKVKLIRSGESTSGIVTLDESNIIGAPKNLKKTTWESTFNQVRVSFEDRVMFYDTSIQMAQDFANIEGKTRIRSTNVDAPGVKDGEVAGKIANRHLALVCAPLYACDIEANREASELRPGSLFKLSWDRYNITDMIMRVTKINLGSLEKGVVSISCIQDRYATPLNNMAAIGIVHPPIGRTEPLEITADQQHYWVPPLMFVPGFTTDNARLTSLIDSLRSQGFVASHVRQPIGMGAEPAYSFQVGYVVDAGYSNATVSQAMRSPEGDHPIFYRKQGRVVGSYPKTAGGYSRVDTSKTLEIEFPDLDQNFANTDLIWKDDFAPTQWTDPVQSPFWTDRLASSIIAIGDELIKAWGARGVTGTKKVTFDIVWRGLVDTLPEDHAPNTKCILRAETRSMGPNPCIAYPVSHGQKLWFSAREMLKSMHPDHPDVIYSGVADVVEGPVMNDRQARPFRPREVLMGPSFVHEPAAVTITNAHLMNYPVKIRPASRFSPYVHLPGDPLHERDFEPPSGGQTFLIQKPGSPAPELAKIQRNFIFWEITWTGANSGSEMWSFGADGFRDPNYFIEHTLSNGFPNLGSSTVTFKYWGAEAFFFKEEGSNFWTTEQGDPDYFYRSLHYIERTLEVIRI